MPGRFTIRLRPRVPAVWRDRMAVGFRLSPYPKLEAARAGQDRRLQAMDDPSVCAVTGDAPIAAPVPFLAASDTGALADLVLSRAARGRVPSRGVGAVL
ncbi:hypothetical protein CR162_19905, partial [Pseudoroseomonas rhizosphaerae]